MSEVFLMYEIFVKKPLAFPVHSENPGDEVGVVVYWSDTELEFLLEREVAEVERGEGLGVWYMHWNWNPWEEEKILDDSFLWSVERKLVERILRQCG